MKNPQGERGLTTLFFTDRFHDKYQKHTTKDRNQHLADKKDTQTFLTTLGYEEFDLGIWITTDATIQKYNREYRHKDKPTDILSFPYHDKLKAGKRIKVQEPEDENLGDLIISAAYVKKMQNVWALRLNAACAASWCTVSAIYWAMII